MTAENMWNKKTASLYKLALLVMLYAITFHSNAASGDTRIEFGPSEVPLNRPFTIKIVVENEYIKSYSDFPEIKGFQKRGTSSSTNTSIVNGKMSVETSITQNYVAEAEGTYKISDFTMQVNGRNVSVAGISIKVLPPAQQPQRRSPFGRDPFEEFFNQQRSNVEYVDVEADAFFAITTDKNEVYKGEGFNLTASLFVSEQNRAQMRFPGDIGKQVADIIKNIKPSNVWEENFNISEIEKTPVSLNGKNYDQYILYQASFFPLNEKEIRIPSQKLKLIKIKTAKSQGFFGAPRQEEWEEFVSKPKTIKVKPLPNHPLKDMVNVGRYELQENLNGVNLETGQSFDYTFRIQGEGNIANIHNPDVPQDKNFDFFEPNTSQNLKRSNGRVWGAKAYTYYGIPKEPGTYHLGDYFQWIYFDSKREVYDTLKSDLTFEVIGESQKNAVILSNDLGPFYDAIDFKDNTLRRIHPPLYIDVIYYTLMALIVGSSLFIFIKR